MKKRQIALFLSVLLIVSLLPISAAAADKPSTDTLFAAMGSVRYTASGIQLYSDGESFVAEGEKGTLTFPIKDFSEASLYLSSDSYYVSYSGNGGLLTFAFRYENKAVTQITILHSSYSALPSAPSVYLPGHDVKIAETANGSVVPGLSYAAPGETVPLSIQAKNGFALAKLDAKDANGKALELRTYSSELVYYVTMPDSDVTITAEFAKADDPEDVDEAFTFDFLGLLSFFRSIRASLHELLRPVFADSGSRIAKALGDSFH